jgi:Cu-Zn family superoxide dismutase
MNRFMSCALVLTSMVIVAAGCKSKDEGDGGSSMKMSSTMGKTAVAKIKPAGAAATQPTNQHVTGQVTFTECGDHCVKVMAHLIGLSPGEHGIHIHEGADLSDPMLKGAGAHYNPQHSHHGGPDTSEHHAGDLGNINADAAGSAHLDITLKGVNLDDLVGKSVIVHAGVDDLKTDPAGNSGGRIAGGVIEIPK